MAAFIIVDTDSGTVTFSDEVLAEFPEITGEVNGNVVRISNVWREDLISLVGGNIYWTKKQPFASFSIIFDENNKTSVDTLSNLLVRYVNYHNGDYEISLPKYSSDVSVLYDPLGLGVRPNYYGELQKYIDGETTIEALSEAIYKLYVIALPDYPSWRQSDDTLGGPDEIQAAISAIPEEDIRKFLDPSPVAVQLYDTVEDNSNSRTSGNKSYSLQTSSQELVFTKNKNDYNFSAICTPGEEAAIFLPDFLMVPIAPYRFYTKKLTATQCLLKHITKDQFFDSRIVSVTTNFGASASIGRGFVLQERMSPSSIQVSIAVSKYGVNNVLLGEFIADILSVIPQEKLGGRLSIDMGGGLGNLASYDFGTSSLTIKNPMVSMAFYYASKLLEANKTDIDEGRVTTKFPTLMPLSSLYYMAYSQCPKIFSSEFGFVQANGDLARDFLDSDNIGRFSPGPWTGWGLYGSTFKANSLETLKKVIGTKAWNRVTHIEATNEDSDIYATAIHLGRTVSGQASWDGSKFTLSDELRDYDSLSKIIAAGANYFDRIYPDDTFHIPNSELELSLHWDFEVDEVQVGNLLLCSFSKELPSLEGYFSSGCDNGRLSDAHSRARYSSALSKIALNGVSLTDISGVADVIAGSDQLAVYSPYKVRDEDMQFFHTLFTTLRNGYRTIFRHTAEDSTAIGDDENSYAYSTLTKILSTLFSVSASNDNAQDTYDKLSALANGGYVTVSQGMPGDAIAPLVIVSNVLYDVYLTKIERQNRTITCNSSIRGNILVESDDLTGEDRVVEYEAGDPDGGYALVGYVQNSPKITLQFLAKETTTGGQTVTKQWEQTYDLKNMSVGTEYHEYQGDVDPTWEGEIPVTPASATISKGNRVIYTPVDNGDGSVTISYQVLDEDDNDITDLFNTLTIGETFLHKELL